MEIKSILVALLILLCVIHVINGLECDKNNKDAITQPKTKGLQVVKDAVKKVRDSGIFPDDKGFMERIAQVESKCGEDKNTYTKMINGKLYCGGIWQVEEVSFKWTQNKDTTKHNAKIAAIETKFGIKWREVKWCDLQCPLYSAIAARLYLSTINSSIPKDLKGQAEYWKEHYNTDDGAGTVEKFVKEADLKGDPHVCQAVPGSDQQLCYLLRGNEGDTYNFLQEPLMGNLEVRGTLSHAVFISQVTILCDLVDVDITLDGVTIAHEVNKWGKAMTHDQGTVHIRQTKRGVTIDFSLVIITVMLKGKHLDLSLKHVGSFSTDASGILGAVAKGVEIIEDDDGAQLVVKSTGEHIKLTHSRSGWQLPHLVRKAPSFHQLIQTQCIN